MKKLFSFLLLFFSVFLCFADEIYESNILGMKLKKIESIYESSNDYVLVITDSDGIELRKLYKESELVSTAEIRTDGNMQTEIRTENGKTETIVREEGIIISEEIIYPDGRYEQSEYQYAGSRLEQTDFSVDGEPVYREVYQYAEGGRLLDVARIHSGEGDNISSSFSFDDGLITGYWMYSGKIKNYIRFEGRSIQLNEIFGEGIEDQLREYEKLAGGFSSETITDKEKGRVIRLIYNKDNLLLEKTLKDDEGRLLEETEYLYEDGFISSVKIRSGLLLENYKYIRDQGGTVKNESFYKNGVLVQETEYESENSYVETLFRGGRAVLRIYYSDGERTATEQIQD